MEQHRDLDTPIWGAEAIGKVIGRSKRQVHHLLARKQIPAKKVGGRFVSTPRQLLAFINGESKGAE